MKTFKEILNENNKDKILYSNGYIWVTYGQGSGTTGYLPDLNKFLTNKKDDVHYDYIVDKLVKFSKKTKPVMQNKKSKLYELPVYPSTEGTYEMWGGNVKPLDKYYLLITHEKDYYIVNVFTNEREAISWIKNVI